MTVHELRKKGYKVRVIHVREDVYKLLKEYVEESYSYRYFLTYLGKSATGGKTVVEIAKERGFAASTIESHLAHYVGLGELDVKQFLNEEKLKKIIEYFNSVENKGFGEAKNHFGDDVSYSELRMGLSYLESMK